MTGPMVVLSQIWRMQIEQSLRMMAWWGQFLPHESAREAAAEAESQRRRA